MKKEPTIYWITTGIFCAAMSMSAFMYFTNDDIKTVFVHLGFPSYFRVELGIAKILGVCALLLPFVPKMVKNFAYAGFIINIISAMIAHLASDDGLGSIILPIILLGFLAVSQLYYQKLTYSVFKE